MLSNPRARMSASRRDRLIDMSALPPKADMGQQSRFPNWDADDHEARNDYYGFGQRDVFFINNTAAAPLARLTPSGTLKSSSLA